MQGAGLPMGALAGEEDSTTPPAQQPDPSAVTLTLQEDTPSPAARAESAPAPLVATAMAERQGAFPLAEAPASAVVAEDLAAAVDLAAAAAGNL